MEVLLTGGSSKFGAELAKQMHFQMNWNVEIVPRLHLDEAIQVTKKHYDLIFFNHNRPVFDWDFDKYPSELLKEVTADRVGWMITYSALNPEMPHEPSSNQFWQYVAQKSIYLHQMKYYSKRFTTFAFDPGIITEENRSNIVSEFIEVCPTIKDVYRSSVGSGL
tara:strand:- start:168 stop:659 length:492 start_codon:yes stop_codon:yes gene_type:complete